MPHVIVDDSIVPSASGAYDLGSVDKPWKDLYVTNNSINKGGTTLRVSNGKLNVAGKPMLSTPIAYTLTFDLIYSRANVSTTIGRATFTPNNMTGVFVFDATNAHNGYYNLTKDNFVLSVYCNSASIYTGTGIFNLNMTIT